MANQQLREALQAYEAANLDEHGPLRGAAFAATYRAAQGLPVHGIAPDTEALNAEAAAWCERTLASLAVIDASALEEQERLSLAILRSAVERRIESTRYYWHVIPVTPYRSFVFGFRMIFNSLDLENAEHRANYLAALRDVGAYVRSLQDKLAGQVQRGITLPQRALAPIIAVHRAAANVESNPLLPGSEKLAALDETTRTAFIAAAHDTLRRDVVPAIGELAEYLAGPYTDAAASGWGQSALPGGDAYYRYLVRSNTTLGFSPEEIHERGLAAVGELREAMASVRARLGAQGTAREFHEMLRHDPRFVPRSPEQIGERLEHFANLANRALDTYFVRKPSAPFAAKRLSETLEGGMTFGYYHPGAKAGEEGVYFYNGSKLSERSLISLASLALHELVPGHHYEINVARENPALPRFRAFQAISTYIPAYHEGWAEYAADLGKEFGAYEDPYDLYGRYALDIFISSRLVVDTGMNSLQWSFERAEEFMRENTLLSDLEINSELTRYATDLPAQGLGYKLGSLTFAGLREKARAKLGSGFDVRAFHDRIVMNGGMPLTLVEHEIERFIDERS
ncbi:MAG TPA: DUF885 domain-containing protein [Candidatus Acidoferrales bacterium]|nr:DUF885 domain-containing protein [Candidatus Acidoferrales bacterium]